MSITTFNVPAEIEKKILCAISLKKELEQYEREIKDALKEAMEQNNIKSIKNENYNVSLVERTTYSPQDKAILPAAFTKTVLDTTKVGTYVKLNGILPTGVVSSTTSSVRWEAK